VTTCFTLPELPLRHTSPEYLALMLWDLADKEEVENVATPLLVDPVPIAAVPS
jgi:hypothetical protein